MFSRLSFFKNPFYYPAIILFFSIFWRFINYQNRWTLSQDQARDGIIGLYALTHHLLPLVGPPSSAGHFSFGPFYYWLIEIFTFLIPAVNGPWIGFTLMAALIPLLFLYFGYILKEKNLGIILGLVSAFSAGLIFNAPDMLNPIPIAFLVTLSFIFLVNLIEREKIFSAFWLGLIIGLAINFHYQSMGLLIFIPLIIFVNKFDLQKRIKVLLLSTTGLIVAFIPLIYFNFTVQNKLLNGFLNFAFHGQSQIGEPIGFLGQLTFWPKLLGNTLASNLWLGVAVILVFGLALVISLSEKKYLSKSVVVIFLALMGQAVILFFYQGVRLPLYLIVYQPFLIFLTGWSIWVFYQFNKYAGIGLLLLLILFAIPADWNISQDNKSQISQILALKKTIDSQVPGPLNLLSDNNSNQLSLPLYYLYLKEGRISEQGTKIIACDNQNLKNGQGIIIGTNCPTDLATLTENGTYNIYDLDQLGDDKRGKFNAGPISQPEIYQWLFNNYQH